MSFRLSALLAVTTPLARKRAAKVGAAGTILGLRDRENLVAGARNLRELTLACQTQHRVKSAARNHLDLQLKDLLSVTLPWASMAHAMTTSNLQRLASLSRASRPGR
jgi:hypothetical protein